MKKLLILILLLSSTALFPQRVSELPPATSAGNGNLFLIVQSGVTKKITYENLINSIGSDPGFITLIGTISGDSVFIGGDTLVVEEGFWDASGNDIINTNSGFVKVDSLMKIYPLPPQATKVGRIVHINQYGQIEWMSPTTLYDTIVRDVMAAGGHIGNVSDSTWKLTNTTAITVHPYNAKKESDPGYAYFYEDPPVYDTTINYKYGYLYNYYASTGTGDTSIANIGWHVATPIDMSNLNDYVNNYSNETELPYDSTSCYLKVQDESYWVYYLGWFECCTNELGFNAVGNGRRKSNGVFEGIRSIAFLITSDSLYGTSYMYGMFDANGTFSYTNHLNYKESGAVRLVKDHTELNDLEIGTYIGNDGKEYSTICYDTTEFLTVNLAETMYRNGTLIPFEGVNSGYFTNSEWSNLNYGARCSYNNSQDSAFSYIIDTVFEYPSYSNILKLDGILDATKYKIQGEDLLIPTELDDFSDVTLTNPDAYDILTLDDESMQWINVPRSSVIPNYWTFLDSATDTLKNNVATGGVTLINGQFQAVDLTDSIFFGNDPRNNVDGRCIEASIFHGDTSNIFSIVSYSGTSSWANGLNCGTDADYAGFSQQYSSGKGFISLGVVYDTMFVSNILIRPDSININADTVHIDGDLDLNGDLTVIGDLTYSDTYWDDLTTSAAQAKVNPATSKPTYNTDSLTLVFDAADSTTNFLVFNFQMSHRFKAGTDISPHVHYAQKSAVDTCEWFIILYKWTDLGEKQPASWTRIHTSNQTIYTYSDGALHQLADFPDISGSGHTESSILDIKLFCWADAALSLKQFDIHFQIDKPGSDNEIP